MGGKDSLMGRLLGSADKFTDKQVAETLAMLIAHGVERGATDIHIEPHERFVLVRYRIDGTLRGVHKLPRAALGTVMARLKTLAELNVQEIRMPQEGEFTQEVGNKQVEVHLNTMPVYGGEKAVLHLSQEVGKLEDLKSLGFWGAGLDALNSTLARPHGLVIVSGPRHSGVTTTLFSLLQSLNSPLVSIATVEAGPTHRLPGVNQTYLHGDISVFDGFRGAIKQDANIVMLDVIPDSQTAELAVHTASNGHMVLTGMREDSSISAVLRLRHVGVEPFLLATSLRVSVGQRLVRKLCTECRVRYELNDEERAGLESSFGIATPAARKRIHELERSAAPAIFGDVKQLNSSPTKMTHLWKPNEGGCEACEHTGYQGRVAIVEVLANTDALHKTLLARDAVSAAEMQSTMLKDGFIPIGLDGLIKALRGQTTATEVLRVLAN